MKGRTDDRLIRGLLSKFPVSEKLVLILWFFLAIVLILLGLSCVTIENLSATRAYVGGEGLWSKAQKQAVYDLLRYSISHSPEDYENYQRELLVPLGDREARLELEKPAPDMSIVRRGLIQGRNDSADVESMAILFRRFRRSRYMSEAIGIWAQGDDLIAQLRVLGDQLHDEISSRRTDRQKIAEIAQQVDIIGTRLTPLEDRFSYALGEAARQARSLFLRVTIGAAAASLASGVLFTFVMLHHMRQTEERYKRLIDTANDVILVLDAETGIIVNANLRSSGVLGLPLSAIVGKQGEQLIVEADREEYLRMVTATKEGKAVVGKQLQVQHPDGAPRVVEVNASLTEVAGKRIIQGVFRDITERRRLEEELRQSQKMEVVGRLAGGIAHDFNNLLMVILLQASKLSQLITQPQLLEYLKTARIAAEKAASLTGQLLAFGKKQVLTLQVLDLNDLLSELRQMLLTLRTEGVQLILSPNSQPLPVNADPGRIEQVIMNLAVNACDAMPSGGRLEIRTGRAATVPADAAKERQTPYAVMEIIDTGSGMDETTKSHIFDPFFTTKPPGKGTGLGLSTVYGIVQQSGGFIEVESALGKGTTFRVFLPLVEQPIRPRTTLKIVSPQQEGSETILIAEDQAAIRTALRDYLESKGYTVLEAQNGMEALELAEQYPGRLDVLVTDIVMPQLRGLELARRISEIHHGVHIIFMSGYSEDALLENRLLSRSNSVLIRKPFEPEELAKMIRQSFVKRP